MSDVVALHRAPKTVAIVAMGRSCDQYIHHCTNLGGRRAMADETWAIGHQGGVIQCDRVFMMNDIRASIEQGERLKLSHVRVALGWLKTHPGPVYVSKALPDYPGTVDYPLDDVVRHLKFGYFNGSVAYAVGLAFLLGVEELKFFGCDYTYADNHLAEKGRACVEWWLMRWMLEGKRLFLAQNTSLLDNDVPQGSKFYGYADDVRAEIVDGETRIIRTPRQMADAAD